MRYGYSNWTPSHSTLMMLMSLVRCSIVTEWGGFHQLQRQDPRLLGRVHQLLVELHFAPSAMIPPTSTELRAFLDHVVTDHGFVTFKWTPNGGQVPKPINFTEPLLKELGLTPQLCCYELHMQRTPGRALRKSHASEYAPPLVAHPRPGFCAVTGGVASWEEAAAHCALENMTDVYFALPWATEMKNLSRCIAACVDMCGHKCRFVSHSLQMQDCSVYSLRKCDLDLLHPSPHGKPHMLMGTDYVSAAVGDIAQRGVSTSARQDPGLPWEPMTTRNERRRATARYHAPLRGMCKHDFAIRTGYRFESM